jgi:hypothetical protein
MITNTRIIISMSISTGTGTRLMLILMTTIMFIHITMSIFTPTFMPVNRSTLTPTKRTPKRNMNMFMPLMNRNLISTRTDTGRLTGYEKGDVVRAPLVLRIIDCRSHDELPVFDSFNTDKLIGNLLDLS